MDKYDIGLTHQVATANPFNRDDDLYFTKRYTTSKFRNKFSY